MSHDQRFFSEQFPRSSQYHPDWILAGASGGAHALWLTEWLTEAMGLQPGMRVLDLGCGRAMSSVFLRREFGVQVWAADLWFDASENLLRIRDAGVEDGVFPMRADARSLPFAAEYFDAVVSSDAFSYFGTDDHYLNYLARFIKPGGRIGIALAGLTRELGNSIPPHLREWWFQDQLWCLHSADWWRQHWERTGLVDVELADMQAEGWRHWVDWLRWVAPDPGPEIGALEADAGRNLGYVRILARRRPGIQMLDPVVSVPAHYQRQPLRRGSEPGEDRVAGR